MEAGFITMAIALAICALIIVYLLSDKIRKKEVTQGMLNIVYEENNRNPQLVLALYDPVEDVTARKTVLFDVNIIRQNSQK